MEQSVFQIVVGPVMRILTDHISKHLGYAACSTKHVNKMRNKMQDLENTSADVKSQMDRNKINNKDIPAGVSDWLNAVEKLKEEVQKIPSDNIGCLNMKTRYQAGRKACKNTATIEELTETNSGFKWTDAPNPTGIVDYKPASSTTASSSGAEVFRSRDEPFNKALNLLQIDADNSPVIALCGMGGVGKTTMMEQLLERVAKENKMFDRFVKVVIGRSPNMLSIQNDVSVQMGGEGLREKTEAASADSLCRKFKEMLQDDKKRVLVILDDVWQNINLKNIGITSPLPKGLKLLLTSRDSNYCSQIATCAGSAIQVIKVDVLKEAEAQNLFCQIAGISKENDEDKYLIGCDIVKACGHLPLAIKLIASALKSKEMFVWRTTLDRLKNREFGDDVKKIIKISYDYIKEDEDKKIFLHCGLFPEDYDIPIEDLMRYAWGLKLFKKVSTLREARDRTNTCVGNLIEANLLIKSDQVGCVKLHDLVLAFVLSEVSKGDHGWIINHGDVSSWDRDAVSESCKSISLTCKGMSEFPSKYRYPNMSLLQLMHGDPSLIFPEDFYDKMENLKVIAYYNMQYPLLPRSLEYSANLKSLFLHECKLVFDMSFIGDLVNLEVLSFAGSGIYWLPSTIGNLKKLKLLDLTGCFKLHIDDGVFKKLKNLEELYMRVSGTQAVRFTDASFEDLMMLSSQLCAMEVEFVNKITHLKYVCFTNLDRFRISVGRLLEPKIENENCAFKNTLNLVTNHSSDLLDCKISELFKKTENLTLEVKYMVRLEDICSFHPLDRSTFSCLSDLEVSKCEKMKYLFTISVATGLRKLENLKISSCNNLEALVHDYGSEINSGCEMLKFGDLKFMSLKGLPKLISLFLVENVVIELPQLIKLEVEELPNFTSIYPDNNNISALLNNQVKIPELKELKIRSMSNLEQIWACRSDEEVNSISMLRVIEVARCDNLVSLFPTNPIRLVNHLEKLKVSECGSIEVIFNIDLESCASEVERLSNSSLKSIEVSDSENLREVWRIKCDENKSSCILSFDAIERISIGNCERFRKIFTSTNVKFDMHALRDLCISGCGEHGRNMELIEYRQHEETKLLSGEEEKDDNISIVAIPSSLVHNFLNLDTLKLINYDGMEVVFEIESGLLSSTDLVTTTTHNQQPLMLLPYLQTLMLRNMESMSHVWKCSNWNKFLILQKQHTQSSFQSLTTISLLFCERIKYLFSPLMAKLLSNLKTINIRWCDSMEEIVSNRDDKDEETAATYETTTLFPHLHSLVLFEMKNLKRIGGDAGVRNEIKFSQVNIVSWSLCQYPRVIRIFSCSELVEIFETQGITNNGGGFGSHTDIDEGRTGTHTTTFAIPRLENIHVPQLSNLKILEIRSCKLLQHVFTFSTLESLKQLEELYISYCSAMEVVVKKENEEQRKVVVFPRLKSIKLSSLPNLKGFFLGMNRFEWPLLETVVIEECPQMVVFTSGVSKAPTLKYIHTDLGKHILDEGGLNFDLTTNLQQMQVPSAESTTLCSLLFKQFPAWYFRNLIELSIRGYHWDDKCHKSLISSNDVPQLQKLERILLQVWNPEVVFEVEAKEGENSESQTILEIPNLTQLELEDVACLEYIWKRNHHHNNRTVWLFPNLTTMIIKRCHSLNYVISSSMVGSLQQLQHLHVYWCSGMKEVVKVEEEEECDAKGKEIVLPCLKSLKLELLYSLEGFYLGMEGLSLPSLHTLKIMGCSNIKVFSRGHVATPALKVFDTSFGRCYVREDINSSMEAIVKIQEEEEKKEEEKKKEEDEKKKKEREDEEDDEEEDEDEEDDEEEDEDEEDDEEEDEDEDEEDDEEEDEEDDEEEDENNDNREDEEDEEEEVHS